MKFMKNQYYLEKNKLYFTIIVIYNVNYKSFNKYSKKGNF